MPNFTGVVRQSVTTFEDVEVECEAASISDALSFFADTGTVLSVTADDVDDASYVGVSPFTRPSRPEVDINFPLAHVEQEDTGYRNVRVHRVAAE